MGTPIERTHDRLLSNLKAAFKDDDPQIRDHWHSNPIKIPDDIVRMLPRTTMVSAKLDIRCPSQSKFKERFQTRGVRVSGIKVGGLHQVKDMDQVTAAGREVRLYVLQELRDFMEEGACFRDKDPYIVPRRQCKEARKVESPCVVRRLGEL